MRMPRGYWTKERVLEEALKYQNRVAFHRGSASAYATAVQRGWLDDVCAHMVWVQKKDWTDASLVEVAKGYRTKGEIRASSKGAYLAIHRRGLTHEAFSHMPEHAQRAADSEYVLYTYKVHPFVYVGITTSAAFRSVSHEISGSADMRWMAKQADMELYGGDPSYPLRTGRTMSREVAERAERRLIRCYAKLGWNVLNKVHNPQYDMQKREYLFTPPSVIYNDISLDCVS